MNTTKGKEERQTSITMRFPLELVNALKEAAPERGFSGYQPLVKYYVREGMRRDQERLHHRAVARFIDSLRSQGVAEQVLSSAAQITWQECPQFLSDAATGDGKHHEEPHGHAHEPRQAAEFSHASRESRGVQGSVGSATTPRCRRSRGGQASLSKERAP